MIMIKGESADSGMLTNVLTLIHVMEYDRKCLNRIQSIEARFGVWVGVREYNLEYGSMTGVPEYYQKRFNIRAYK